MECNVRCVGSGFATLRSAVAVVVVGRFGYLCRAREKMIEGRDSKHNVNKRKGRTDEKVKESGWGSEGTPNVLTLLAPTQQATPLPI